MRILLLANNWVGWEITKFLSSDTDVDIVGLGIHAPSKQKYTKYILQSVNLPKSKILLGSTFKQSTTIERIRRLKPDLIISAFWGYILTKDIIAIPTKGSINFHPGYLPTNRGMNPNVWPFIDNTPAGVTIHYVDEGIDTGDIIARRKVPITPYDTAESIYEKTMADIVELFKEIWPNIKKGTAPRINQKTLPEISTHHYAQDIESINTIDVDKTYTGQQLINLLKARSYQDKLFLSYTDKGDQVYLSVQLYSPKKLPVNTKSEYQKYVEYALKSYKEPYRPLIISVQNNLKIKLKPFTRKDIDDEQLVQILTRWRKKAQPFFPSTFRVTNERTKKWLQSELINKNDRILFLIYLQDRKTPLGHVGLYRFEWDSYSCQIDNVIKGINRKETKGIMTMAIHELGEWALNHLGVRTLTLYVFEDNEKAVNLYTRCGFIIKKRIPQRFEKLNSQEFHWVNDDRISIMKPERVLLYMVKYLSKG